MTNLKTSKSHQSQDGQALHPDERGRARSEFSTAPPRFPCNTRSGESPAVQTSTAHAKMSWPFLAILCGSNTKKGFE